MGLPIVIAMWGNKKDWSEFSNVTSVIGVVIAVFTWIIFTGEATSGVVPGDYNAASPIFFGIMVITYVILGLSLLARYLDNKNLCLTLSVMLAVVLMIPSNALAIGKGTNTHVEWKSCLGVFHCTNSPNWHGDDSKLLAYKQMNKGEMIPFYAEEEPIEYVQRMSKARKIDSRPDWLHQMLVRGEFTDQPDFSPLFLGWGTFHYEYDGSEFAGGDFVEIDGTWLLSVLPEFNEVIIYFSLDRLDMDEMIKHYHPSWKVRKAIDHWIVYTDIDYPTYQTHYQEGFTSDDLNYILDRESVIRPLLYHEIQTSLPFLQEVFIEQSLFENR